MELGHKILFGLAAVMLLLSGCADELKDAGGLASDLGELSELLPDDLLDNGQGQNAELCGNNAIDAGEHCDGNDLGGCLSGCTGRCRCARDSSADGNATNGGTIKIASWNIQNFGQSKAGDENRMAVIAEVISHFDLIAVQEISNLYEMGDAGCARNEGKCPAHVNCGLVQNALESALAGSGRTYAFLFSPQIRDERYLYIYDSDVVELLNEGAFVFDSGDNAELNVCDTEAPEGRVARQPFYASFRSGNFDFTLMNVHTSISNDNMAELAALQEFFAQVRDADETENDIILLGDHNTDGTYVDGDCADYFEANVEAFPFNAIPCDMMTNLADNKSYDKIIMYADTFDNEFIHGSGAVYREGITKEISDHFLVYAEFSTGIEDDDG
ncbi:endonuclease/exonuclease/phosphatase family protein [Candidatus Micrarchaeota archaeon]|nr:endonuclease/exonuclease/phosphatase family protein [Candidatus Micrarchaeota archaeon]